jgi:capsular polysaccharide biosynthesis protein
MSARQTVGREKLRPSTERRRNTHETLVTLWRGKLLIIVVFVVSLLLGSLGIVLYGLRYTSEAIIQVNFESKVKIDGAGGQPPVPMDATALIDSAAQLIRSRATAGAVVDRLRLDQDPYFAREPLSWRALSRLRALAGLPTATPSRRDLAVEALRRRVIVAVEPRTYVISISVTTNDPQEAAMIANSVAEEYLYEEKVNRLASSRATSERALAELSSVYGVRHPSYVLEKARIRQLQGVENAMKQDDAPALPSNERFLPAEAVLIPSSPNAPLVLGLTAGVAIASTVWIILRLGPVYFLRTSIAPTREPTATIKEPTRTPIGIARPRLTLHGIAIALALIGGILFLWSLIQASSSLFKSFGA